MNMIQHSILHILNKEKILHLIFR